jgi:hypothetical protein
MEKLCTNKNHSYKYNEQINKQNIDNSECLCVKFVKIYPEITIWVFLRFPILLTDDCMCNFMSRILIDSLAIKNPYLRLIKMCL